MYPPTELDLNLVSFLEQHQVDAYFVGGCVRDRLLGRPLHDLDLVVAGDALALARRLANRLGGAYFAMHQEHATGRILLHLPTRGRITVDVSPFRGDGTLAADLALRDFTINAMAVAPALWLSGWPAANPPVIDPHGGLADLAARRVRAVSGQTFRSDPLRLLRAVRVAADIGGQIDPATEALIQQYALLLPTVSWERIRDEFIRILAPAGAAGRLRELDRLGLLTQVLPELRLARGITQPPPHHLDVLSHLLLTVDRLEGIYRAIGNLESEIRSPESLGSSALAPESVWAPVARTFAPFAHQVQTYLAGILTDERPLSVLLKLAALLHDIGKPATRTVDEDGDIHFYGHERVGAEIAVEVCRRLRLGAREVAWVTRVVRNHMRPLWLAGTRDVTRRAIYRFFCDTDEAGVAIIPLSAADVLATREPVDDPAHWVHFLEVLHTLLGSYYSEDSPIIALPKLIDGRDIMDEFGLSPGPRIRQLLEAVREAQAMGEVTNPEEAREYVRRQLLRE